MRVALYDFEMTVPNDWKIAIEPKSEYKSGIVALKPTSNPNESVDLVWEELAKRIEKYPTVESFIEQYFNSMKGVRDVKNFQVSKGSVITRGGHSLLPHEFSYTYKRYMRKEFTQQVIGMAMYDTHSSRFAIIYAKIDKTKGQGEEASRRSVIDSFNCACETPSI